MIRVSYSSSPSSIPHALCPWPEKLSFPTRGCFKIACAHRGLQRHWAFYYRYVVDSGEKNLRFLPVVATFSSLLYLFYLSIIEDSERPIALHLDRSAAEL